MRSDNQTDELSSSEEGGEWLDVGPDEEEKVEILSLFDDEVFPDALSMLDHCKHKHGFDFKETCTRLSLDFHGAVKLINYIRFQVRHGLEVPLTVAPSDIEDEGLLKPVIENDSLIVCLDDVLGHQGGPPLADFVEGETTPAALKARNTELEAEVASLRDQFEHYRLIVQETLDRRWGEDDVAPAATLPRPNETDSSVGYFDSYSYNDIHETMLKDTVRTDAYRDFIYGNKHLFKDKVVLDVGCGTGILSMFCAKAGAKHVFAVDKSEIINKARENVYNNGLSDAITCLGGMVEDITLPVDKVDIIVSEWMGYCLLYEAMLRSVLVARDRFLKPGGLLAPGVVTLWLAPIEDPDYIADQIGFWTDVYGFDMRAMRTGIYEDVRVQTMPHGTLCGTPTPFLQLPLHSMKLEDLVFTTKWETTLLRDVGSVDGFLVWFDTYFTDSPDDSVPLEDTAAGWTKQKPNKVAFTTGPTGKETHWKQGLLLIDQTKYQDSLSKDARLEGEITYAHPDENPRALSVTMTWDNSRGEKKCQSWALR